MTINDDYPYYDDPMTETGLVIPSPETKIEDALKTQYVKYVTSYLILKTR